MEARSIAWRLGSGALGRGISVALAMGSVTLGLLGLVLYSVVTPTFMFRADWYAVTVILTAAVVGLALAGWVITLRDHRLTIGWLILALAVLTGFRTFSEPYAARAVELGPGVLPAGDLTIWASLWVEPLALGWLAVVPLFFPSGHLVSGRWGRLVWVAMGATFFLGASVAFRSGPMTHNALWGIINPGGLSALDPFLPPLRQIAGAALAICIVLSYASLLVRFTRSTGEEREQMKWGALSLALLAIALPLYLLDRESITFALLLVVALMSLPTAIGVAVLKYHLFGIDYLINRALVYGIFTALVAGTYMSLVRLGQIVSGQSSALGSEAGIVGSTLIFGAIFLPAKNRLQRAVDRYLGPAPSTTLINQNEDLRRTADQDDRELLVSFLEDSVSALGAEGGSLFVYDGDEPTRVAHVEMPDAAGAIRIGMRCEGQHVGHLLLGPRANGAPYSEADLRVLQSSADLAARALRLTGTAQTRP